MTIASPSNLHNRSKKLFLGRKGFSLERAKQQNLLFDAHVKAFLRQWLIKGSPEGSGLETHEQAIEEFIGGGALREYFKRHDKPFQKLLASRWIAKHLFRRHYHVYFNPVTHEPELSQYESRIYNLSAHRQHLSIPYRFIPVSRQGSNGDRATSEELAPERQGKNNDIGDYFATRRADETTVKTMHSDLKRSMKGRQKHIHLIDTHYMPDAIKVVSERMQEAARSGEHRPEFYVLQSRYRPEGMDRHFGAALLVTNPSDPSCPRRIIFCDTVNLPGWSPLFGTMIKNVFGARAEQMIEVASHPLQGLNLEPSITEHDINCSFYTHAMAGALLNLAQKHPQLLLFGTIEKVQQAMKGSMHDYYERTGSAKPTHAINRINLYKRWNLGHNMLMHLSLTS